MPNSLVNDDAFAMVGRSKEFSTTKGQVSLPALFPRKPKGENKKEYFRWETPKKMKHLGNCIVGIRPIDPRKVDEWNKTRKYILNNPLVKCCLQDNFDKEVFKKAMLALHLKYKSAWASGHGCS